ncbi:tyrosine-type recombinase/integrase [Ruegeria atlantica]|uniref:tyrosine-type recombinase/integrase n=1 Tax=Ruegeria atlantica TaxID=81569 RepID=UPI001480C53F|nr:site-specific integrase [Ruegeria atlantica]
MLYTGAARVDAVRLGHFNIKDDRLTYYRQKTAGQSGIEVVIPMHVDLAQVLAKLPQDRPFLATRNGTTRSENSLGNMMRKWCDEAGLPKCSAHGLRKACARRLAEAGATAHEIMAITGHKTLSLVQLYTEKAERTGMADSAVAKLSQRTNSEKNMANQQ